MSSVHRRLPLDLWCIGILYALVSSPALAAGFSGFDLKFIGDSNPAKAEFDDDIEATSSVRGTATVDLFSRLWIDTDDRASGFGLSGLASYEHNVDIEKLGESIYKVSLGGFNENKKKFGKPFYRYGVSFGYIDSETEIRDGSVIGLSFSFNLEPTRFFDTTVGVLIEKRDAETEVFDTTKTQLFLTANFSPADRIVFRTGLRYVIGDEVSSATPTLNIVNTANVIESDPAFGGIAEERFAYLIDANSAILEAGVGYEISSAVQGNLLYRFVSTKADGDIGYDRSMFELTLSFDL